MPNYVEDEVKRVAGAVGGGKQNFWEGLLQDRPDAGGVGSFLTGMGRQMTANREASNERDLSRDGFRLRAEDQYQQGLVNQRQLESDAFRKALIGRLTQRAEDTNVDRSGFHSAVPTIKIGGGISPSDLAGSPAGALLERAALDRLEHPAPVERLQATPEQGTGFWEGLVGAGGAALKLGGNKLMPAVLGKIAPAVGSALGIGGGSGAAASIAATQAAVHGASTAGAAGAGAGIGGAGLATLGIGAAVGAALLAWQKNRNSTKNARDAFAQELGLGDTERLYAHLATLGPEGQQLREEGLNVIGKKDSAANGPWMERVGQLLDKSGYVPQPARGGRPARA